MPEEGAVFLKQVVCHKSLAFADTTSGANNLSGNGAWAGLASSSVSAFLLSVYVFFHFHGYSRRVAVAKVAQKRRFHQDFRPFLIRMICLAISIGTIPPSEILGKNRASCSFSGSILSTGVMATFRALPGLGAEIIVLGYCNLTR